MHTPVAYSISATLVKYSIVSSDGREGVKRSKPRVKLLVSIDHSKPMPCEISQLIGLLARNGRILKQESGTTSD